MHNEYACLCYELQMYTLYTNDYELWHKLNMSHLIFCVRNIFFYNEPHVTIMLGRIYVFTKKKYHKKKKMNHL